MGSTQNGGRIDETESKGVVIGDKTYTMESTPLETTGSGYIAPIPAYPENIDLLDRVRHVGWEGRGEAGMYMEN